MGIRIHKILGYALADLNVSEGSFDITEDERIDPNGFMSLSWEERKEVYTSKRFHVEVELMCSNDDFFDSGYGLHLLRHQFKEGKIEKYPFDNMCIWDPEFGLSNVLLFIPPSKALNVGERNSWYRYDDIIDYMEENKEATPKIRFLNQPIYPYLRWMDLRDPPKEIDTELVRLINHFKERGGMTMSWDALHDKYGFLHLEEAEENIAPIVPPELVHTLRYLHIFKDPETAYQLRPAIYTYWG